MNERNKNNHLQPWQLLRQQQQYQQQQYQQQQQYHQDEHYQQDYPNQSQERSTAPQHLQEQPQEQQQQQHLQRHSQKQQQHRIVSIAFLGILLLLSSSSFVGISNLLTTTTTATMPRTTFHEDYNNHTFLLSNQQQQQYYQHSLNYHEHICQEKLNQLDELFDTKRRVRQEYNVQNPKPSKYPTNGYIIGIFKQLMNIYEPEAICFTEERFGGSTGRGVVGKGGGTVSGVENMDINTSNTTTTTSTSTTSNIVRYQSYGDGPKFVCGVDVIAQRQTTTTTTTNDTTTTVASTTMPNCLVYSIGSNNDLSFESSVKQFMPNCEIHTFDPTITEESFVGDPTITTFHSWGLGKGNGHVVHLSRDKIPFGTHDVTFETFSLETIYHNKLHHTGRIIDILKIDCEGCEYDILPPIFDAIANGTLVVNQIQVELHIIHFDNPKKYMKLEFQNIQRIFHTADQANMRIFHKERNGWGCDGYKCVEYSFVSHSFLRTVNANVLC